MAEVPSPSDPHEIEGAAQPRWSWGSERSRTGGIDEIPLHHRAGRLLLCSKHHIGPDVEQVLTTHRVDTVVCLTQRHELDPRFPAYVHWLDHNPAHAIWRPTPDLGTLPFDEMLTLIDDVDDRLQRGAGVVVHCAAGIGRSGTLAVGLLLRHGLSLDDSLAHVAAHRSLAGPETGPQRELVEQLEGHERARQDGV